MDAPTDPARLAAFDGVIGILGIGLSSEMRRARCCAALLTLLDSHADIHGSRRMRQRADRNQIDAGLGDRADGFEGDVAGNFEHEPSLRRSRAPCGCRRASCCRAGSRRRRLERFFNLRERLAFDLDSKAYAARAARALDRGVDRAGRRDMVVLDQHAAVEAEAMVVPAADADRILLDDAQARMGLARVDNFRARARDRIDEARVVVAIPDSSCTKLSAVRSPISSPASMPSISASTSPALQSRALGRELDDMRLGASHAATRAR